MIKTTIALVLFLFPLAYSPGPGNLFFAANSAGFGFRATLPANIGYQIATWIVTLAIGFGFIAVLESVPQVLTALKSAGALYVFRLAWKSLKAGLLEGAQEAQAATFTDGVVLLLLNPKAYVIIALMFTQFMDQVELGRTTGVILIASVFTLNNLLAFSIWAWAGSILAGWFRTPQSANRLNSFFGGVLALVALWMLLS